MATNSKERIDFRELFDRAIDAGESEIKAANLLLSRLKDKKGSVIAHGVYRRWDDESPEVRRLRRGGAHFPQMQERMPRATYHTKVPKHLWLELEVVERDLTSSWYDKELSSRDCKLLDWLKGCLVIRQTDWTADGDSQFKEEYFSLQLLASDANHILAELSGAEPKRGPGRGRGISNPEEQAWVDKVVAVVKAGDGRPLGRIVNALLSAEGNKHADQRFVERVKYNAKSALK